MRAGDLDGLRGLNAVDLERNWLRSLLAGLFKDLSAARWARLNNNRLAVLREDTFVDLAALTSLRIDSNQLAALPAGVFSGQGLTTLWMNNNRISTAPAGLFDGLDTLSVLHMYTNGFTTLPAGLFADLTSHKKLWRDHAVSPASAHAHRRSRTPSWRSFRTSATARWSQTATSPLLWPLRRPWRCATDTPRFPPSTVHTAVSLPSGLQDAHEPFVLPSHVP